jgi:hypothetical protein
MESANKEGPYHIGILGISDWRRKFEGIRLTGREVMSCERHLHLGVYVVL